MRLLGYLEIVVLYMITKCGGERIGLLKGPNR